MNKLIPILENLKNPKWRESLSDQSKTTIAWGFTFLLLLLGCTLLVGIGWLVHYIHTLELWPTIFYVIETVLAFIILTIVFLWVSFSIKHGVYVYLFNEESTTSNPERWHSNTGNRPTEKRVHIKRVSGKVEWNVDTALVDWSLSGENPVMLYIEPKGKHFLKDKC